MMFISVDLPEPDAPMMATNSPLWIVRLTSRSTVSGSPPVVYVRPTAFNSRRPRRPQRFSSPAPHSKTHTEQCTPPARCRKKISRPRQSLSSLYSLQRSHDGKQIVQVSACRGTHLAEADFPKVVRRRLATALLRCFARVRSRYWQVSEVPMPSRRFLLPAPSRLNASSRPHLSS